MDDVGIRELKTHLSRYLKRVRAGARIRVTEHGRAVATLVPVAQSDESAEVEWARRMVSAGKAQWTGAKPRGVPPGRKPRKPTSGSAVADAVLEDRR